MAGDGQVMVGWTITDTNIRKIRRLDDGRIVGAAGSASTLSQACDWFEGVVKEKPKIDEDSCLLMLHPDGRLEYYGSNLVAIPGNAPQAIGSGMSFALAAMDMGASAKQAVEAAAKRCAGTGGDIVSLAIDGNDE